MTLIYITLAWVSGLYISANANPDPALPLLVGLLLLPGLVYFRKDRPVLLWVVLFLSLGMLRFEQSRPVHDDQHIIHLNDQGILTLRGVVIAEPESREARVRLLVDAEEAAGHDVHGRVLVTVSLSNEVAYGDEVRLFGRLVTPPVGDTFSYRDYLIRQDVFSVMNGADLEILAHDRASPFFAALFDIKDRARTFIKRALPEPQASLLMGILLGDESGLPESTADAFTRTGTAHVIAISGFNMVILAELLMMVLGWVMPQRRGVSAFLAISLIAIYTLFVGAGGAVVRAAIMSGLLVAGRAMRRRSYAPASLAFTILAMSLHDPWALWDVGFQLSAAAVLGMVLFVRPMERSVRRRIEERTSKNTAHKLMGILSETVIVTTAAQITTTPLILYYFGRLSVVSMPVNLLIIPVQTPLLFFGATGTLIGMAIPALGELVLNIAWIFLTWTVSVVEFFGTLSWADRPLSISREVLSVLALALILLMLYRAVRPAWAMNLLDRWKNQFALRAVQSGAAIAVVLLGNAVLERPDGRLHITYFDTGSSVLIQTPEGATVLIDGGRFPTRLLEGLGDHLPSRTRRLDLLIVTSALEENTVALLEVAERYDISAVVTTGQLSPEPGYRTLLERLESQDTQISTVSAGYQIVIGDGVTIEVLAPQSIPDAGAEPENASLVLRLDYGEARFLFTGAARADLELALLSNPHLIQANVLQVGDHGSDKANSAAFIRTVGPQVAVIQVEQGNQAGDPSPTVVSRLESTQIFRTDRQGIIAVSTDGQTLEIRPEE